MNNNNCCCSRCDSMCGSSYYKCGDAGCDYRLDLGCALTIKIVHRSHPHRLTATRCMSLASVLCAACGTQHHWQQKESTKLEWKVWYVCSPCDFWVHPDCAILPNAIILDDEHHPHPLLLIYLSQDVVIQECGICGQEGGSYSGWGLYVCLYCRYLVHPQCVVYSDPHHPIHFEPVKVRDAQIPGLLHLPMQNERTSVMAHILTTNNTAAAIALLNGGECSSSNNIRSSTSGSGIVSNEKIHEHPLILHDHHDDVDIVCNACVQLISPSDPFYSCTTTTTTTTFNNNSNELGAAAADGGGCRDFFLHMCCAHLPTEITIQHMSHRDNNHPLTLVMNIPHHRDHMIFMCAGCERQCNGFAYACETCNFHVDVVCAFMHTSITHHAHAKSHILHPLYQSWMNRCICCAQSIKDCSNICYTCSNCHNFGIHAECALLPDTLTHKFDKHPLNLITTTQNAIDTDDLDEHHHLVRGEHMFCEICEKDIDNKRTWYYGCKECDNYFHPACFPCLDRLSKIKFGFTVRVACHDCPLTCVRALSVEGYRCGCGTCDRKIIEESDELAFECSECYFRIRGECAFRQINH